MEINTYINSQLETIQNKAIAFLTNLQSKNQDKTIELMRLVSSKQENCAHKFNLLDEINKCKDQVVRIEAQHAEAERNLLVEGINQLGSCVMQSYHLYNVHKKKTGFESKINKCYDVFHELTTLRFENLLTSDLKNLKSMK